MTPAEQAIVAATRVYGPLGVEAAQLAPFLAQQGRAERVDAHADLVLAFACGTGVTQALEQLERHVLSRLPLALQRIDGGTTIIDEVLQELRVRLLAGERPAILGYLGKGSLHGWLKTSAVRLALELVRAGPAAVDPQAELSALLGTVDVERMQLKAEHGPRFRAAFKAAFEALSSRERAVLRLHVAEGMSIDRIAAVYTIHRATAARWVARVREVLLENTRQLFMRDTGVSPDELSSLMRSLVSELDLSIERRLREG